MSCLYCGSTKRFEPVNVCICGRSGSWGPPYKPEIIECHAQFDTPDWLRTIRRAWYAANPVNGPIIAKAIALAK